MGRRIGKGGTGGAPGDSNIFTKKSIDGQA